MIRACKLPTPFLYGKIFSSVISPPYTINAKTQRLTSRGNIYIMASDRFTLFFGQPWLRLQCRRTPATYWMTGSLGMGGVSCGRRSRRSTHQPMCLQTLPVAGCLIEQPECLPEDLCLKSNTGYLLLVTAVNTGSYIQQEQGASITLKNDRSNLTNEREGCRTGVSLTMELLNLNHSPRM